MHHFLFSGEGMIFILSFAWIRTTQRCNMRSTKICILFPWHAIVTFTFSKLLLIRLIITEWRYQNFDRNRDFFYDTKFSETETFFRDQFFPKPKPILFLYQIFQNRNSQKFQNQEVSKPKCPSLAPMHLVGLEMAWDAFIAPRLGRKVIVQNVF